MGAAGRISSRSNDDKCEVCTIPSCTSPCGIISQLFDCLNVCAGALLGVCGALHLGRVKFVSGRKYVNQQNMPRESSRICISTSSSPPVSAKCVCDALSMNCKACWCQYRKRVKTVRRQRPKRRSWLRFHPLLTVMSVTSCVLAPTQTRPICSPYCLCVCSKCIRLCFTLSCCLLIVLIAAASVPSQSAAILHTETSEFAFGDFSPEFIAKIFDLRSVVRGLLRHLGAIALCLRRCAIDCVPCLPVPVRKVAAAAVLSIASAPNNFLLPADLIHRSFYVVQW